MAERTGLPTNPIETWPERHQKIVESFRQRIGEITALEEAFALSRKDAIFIYYRFRSDDMGEWDKMAGAEWDLTHKFPDTTICIATEDIEHSYGDDQFEIPKRAVSIFKRTIS